MPARLVCSVADTFLASLFTTLNFQDVFSVRLYFYTLL
jgi:hypothetical protein